MKELELTPHAVQDGDEVKIDFAQKWGLSYFDVKNGKAFVDFVGLILKKDEVLLSFPKHFSYSNLSPEHKSRTMKEILLLIAKGVSSSYDERNSKNFPLDSYLAVQDYYKKYGLHFVTVKERRKGYGGRIDWRRTIRKSDKILQENGLVFLPFVTVKVKNVSEFLADCMEFVLNYTYQLFSDYLDFLTPYKRKPRNSIFSNFNQSVKELKKIRNQFFKDTEKALIDALVKFFEWRANQSDKVTIATTRFENYWESMIEVYLNHCFIRFNKDNTIEWGESGSVEFKKSKKNEEYIEDNSVRLEKDNKAWYIEFDHIHVNHDDKEIYLLDSKYIYKDGFSGFNYKQAFYYYYLKQYYQGYKIYNGLIAPTELEYHHKLHVNRANRTDYPKYDDGLLIYEHYVNLSKVVEFITSYHLSEFKQNLR